MLILNQTHMIEDIEIPEEVPLMTLSDAVLFPQAIMPLFIFEPRYRKMLRDVLPENRILAIATLDQRTKEATHTEAFYPVAGIGVIRACKQNPDGNSNLILQGIARVRFESITREKPYRTARIRRIVSHPGGSEEQMLSTKKQLIYLIRTQRRLGAKIPKEIIEFLSNVNATEELLDLAIYILCSSTSLKLELLETSAVIPRFKKFELFLEKEILQLKLNSKLKGNLNDDDIGNN